VSGHAHPKALLHLLGSEHDDRTRRLAAAGHGIQQEKVVAAFHLAQECEAQRASIQHLDTGKLACSQPSSGCDTYAFVTIEDVSHSQDQHT
jgi:hypothetical protein